MNVVDRVVKSSACRAHHRLILAATMLLSSIPVLAQRHAEEVTVTVIQVPVVVTRGGDPVTGLTRDDFEVRINGRQRPVDYFDVLEFDSPDGRRAAATAAPKSLTQRRLTLIVFDIATSSFINIRRARKHAEEYVRGSSEAEYFGVALYTGAGGVRYVVPFTHDRAVVLRAINTLSPSRSSDVLGLGMSAQERAVVMPPGNSGPSARITERAHTDDLLEGSLSFEEAIENLGGRGVPSVINQLERERRWNVASDAEGWAEALGAFAEDMAPLEGVKEVLLFSDGTAIGDQETLTFGHALGRLRRQFALGGAVLHIVDIGGLRTPDSASRCGGGCSPELFFPAAYDTGGSVLQNADVSTSLRTLAKRRGVTYLLGVRPPSNEREQNDIVVSVKGQPALTEVLYRRGYARSNQERGEVTALFLADVMLNDIRRNDVTVKLDAGQTAETTVIDVGMPSNELLSHEHLGFVTVDVILYLFDESGNVVGSRHRRMRLNAHDTREKLRGAELVRRERFTLGPGRYAVKALVHIVGRDLVGFQRTDLEVPHAQAAAH